MRKSASHLLSWLVVFCFLGTAAFAAPLSWNEKDKTFDADVSAMALPELLRNISTLTGWEIYQEPGISHSASAKFKNNSRADALRKLLGDLNFEISPQSNAVPKLFVFRTGAGKATELIRAEQGKIILGKNKVIANHLIVSLKPGSKISIAVLAQQLGGKIIGKIDGVDSYLLEFPDAATADAARGELAKVDSVASVDSNYSLDRPSPVNLAAVDRGASPFTLKAGANGGDGKDVIIGLIDTGVQKLGADMQGFLLPGISVAGQANLNGADPLHGTTMAESMLFGLNSTASQGQPISVRILPVDIYGDGRDTDTFKVASGIVQAVNNGANIISLSLGSTGDSAFLYSLIREVNQKGIPIFAAAGNEPVRTATYPAAYPEVVAVTSAQDQKGTVASYANRGSFVDVILPGATIVSYSGRNYYVTGTSVSTALASGMMAGLVNTSGRPPAQILPAFRQSIAFRPQ